MLFNIIGTILITRVVSYVALLGPFRSMRVNAIIRAHALSCILLATLVVSMYASLGIFSFKRLAWYVPMQTLWLVFDLLTRPRHKSASSLSAGA